MYIYKEYEEYSWKPTFISKEKDRGKYCIYLYALDYQKQPHQYKGFLPVSFGEDKHLRDDMYQPIVNLVDNRWVVGQDLCYEALTEVVESAAPTIGDVQSVFEDVVNRHRNLLDEDKSLAVFPAPKHP